jgi:glycosyltransferase involved in cell wall biosynthesis
MRIFIDCSHIDFSRQPTGIPRVVLQYIEYGYKWSNKTAVEVIPVITTFSGLIAVRPVPGSGKPAYLDEFEVDSHGPARADSMLELSAYYLQSALVEANLKPSAADCVTAVHNAFQGLKAEADIQPLEINEGDILFCPAYWHDVPPQFFSRLQRLGCKIVTLVHDILPVTYSKFYQAPWKYEFEANLIAAMRNSDALYAVSQATADSMLELAERNGIRGAKVGIASNCYHPLVSPEMQQRIVSEKFMPTLRKAERYDLIREKNPFLMVGSVEPKKGHIPTIRSFEALWDSGLERPLLIAGRKGWLEESVVHTICKSRYFDKKLFWFEDFDDLDLFFAYYHSRGLVFSSYAEGFGIPMIEALSIGRPVIGYDTLINREVLGEYGLMYDNMASFAKHVLWLDSKEGFAAACQDVASFHWPSWMEVTTNLFNALTTQFAAETQ